MTELPRVDVLMVYQGAPGDLIKAAVDNGANVLTLGATLLSTDELVERFDIARVQKNPARFDEQKLRWMNGRYVRELAVDALTERLESLTGRSGLRGAVEIVAARTDRERRVAEDAYNEQDPARVAGQLRSAAAALADEETVKGYLGVGVSASTKGQS